MRSEGEDRAPRSAEYIEERTPRSAEYIEERARKNAEYIVETGCTVRACAEALGSSKSTVHTEGTL